MSDDSSAPKSLLQKWLEVIDDSDDEFLQKFNEYCELSFLIHIYSCTLDSWDHRTHLRIAWVILTRYGRKDGLRLIFDGIKKFISTSKRTNGKTFHETLTYFWIQMVHYAMVATKNPNNEFRTFLVMNPQLSEGQLWNTYYSKELLMMKPEARNQMVLPDLKPLPSIIAPSSIFSCATHFNIF